MNSAPDTKMQPRNEQINEAKHSLSNAITHLEDMLIDLSLYRTHEDAWMADQSERIQSVVRALRDIFSPK
ncbi:MAG: hypothetical protein ACYSUB_20755 [Planctomycetota bacterium]|jgi:hypothetical protein